MVFDAPEPCQEVEFDEPADKFIGRRASARSAIRVPAIFSLGEAMADVVVADISATGARLLAPSPPPPGYEGLLTWEGIDCPCRIAWSGKDSFGVSFLETTPAIQELASQGNRPANEVLAALPIPGAIQPQPWKTHVLPTARRVIERPAEVRQGDNWIKVVLRSISQRGFEVGWFPRCREQAPISLRGRGLPLLHGRVVASDNLIVRCKLREPLHQSVYQHIAVQLGIEA